MGMIVYVVMGSTGEYSDHREWPVHARTSEVKAADDVVELTALANTLTDADTNCRYESQERWTPAYRAMQAADPGFDTDYTGTRYTVMPVNVKED